ncbi:MAG TPA: glutathione S-transferase family protein [Burkholderiaceae bacterium]|jgi:glutathione S-transferase
MSDIIFHHYQTSPFSEKIRLIFGYKNISWKSVNIPAIMPKPDVVALTGGYRRTPVMQIGADIYCDTALIADVLERLFPTSSLYPANLEGSARILAQWADSTLFWSAIPYSFQPAGMQNVFGNMPPEHMQAFAADRAKFRGTVPRMSTAEATGQVREAVKRLENMLAGGDFLQGAQATIADFSVYHAIWFIRDVAKLGAILDPAPKLRAWSDRMAAFGHGQSSSLSSADALSIAREHKTEDLSARPFVDLHGIALGEQVNIFPSDYGIDPVQGTLVLADANELAVRRKDDRAGEVVVHFPRLGFQLKKVEA